MAEHPTGETADSPSRPLERPVPKKPRESWASIIMAALLAIGVVLLLIVLTLGMFLNVLIAVAGVFAFASFHYLIWGRWLSETLRKAEAEATAKEAAARSSSRHDGDELSS